MKRGVTWGTIIGGGTVWAHKSSADGKPANNTVAAMARGRIGNTLIITFTALVPKDYFIRHLLVMPPGRIAAA